MIYYPKVIRSFSFLSRGRNRSTVSFPTWIEETIRAIIHVGWMRGLKVRNERRRDRALIGEYAGRMKQPM
jgi:hypothetical protein